MRILTRGDLYPLGSRVTSRGVNFAIFSENAERVELCLFSGPGDTIEERFTLPARSQDIWHGHVEGVSSGQRYGYRVHGKWAPAAGAWFNPEKLVLDPYARQLSGPVRIEPVHYHYRQHNEEVVRDEVDNAGRLPKCVVTPVAGPLAVPRPRINWTDMLIYECHVKGLTQRHPGLSLNDRGRYAGAGHPRIVSYLQDLGITSLELLPVQEFVDEAFLGAIGLSNYWGYNPISYFVPSSRYARVDGQTEFRTMVDKLHDANIEVILDVVYNHTAEGNERGPTFSFRGIDNASYYRLQAGAPGQYINDSGCGNSLNVAHPEVLRLVTDSLRYWVQQMGVDGFRFDLASSLGRAHNGYSSDAAFFQVLKQDPVLRTVKLIAEPWDLGIGGYQLGQFPKGWSEWNDQYRDTMRRFWRGDSGTLPDFARHIHGASDLFEAPGRPPQAGVNFITSHDGFTLIDLVSYEHKHNEANLEQNRDGHNGNYSFNCGVEGETDNPAIRRLRLKQQKNLLMTLMVSQGVPMILAGDEFGRSQGGNNNAYCHDNELSWLHWDQTEETDAGILLDFSRRLAGMRRKFPELRCERFIHGVEYGHYAGLDEIEWFHPDARPMEAEDWHDTSLRTLGLLLHGEAIFPNADGGQSLLLIYYNAAPSDVEVNLPEVPMAGAWCCILATTTCQADNQVFDCLETFTMERQSMVMLKFRRTDTP